MTAPLLKWAGGKRALAPRIAPRIAELLAETGGRYFEPFLGGGAVALELGAGVDRMLSDIEEPLITTYQAVRDEPQRVARALRKLAQRGTDKAAYYHVRDRYRPRRAAFVAARQLYLNRLGYNGLYRTNSDGRFNVPFAGDGRARHLHTAAEIARASEALAGAELAVAHYGCALMAAEPGDVVYADPPYDGGYVGYSRAGFDQHEQRFLSELLRWLGSRGIHWVATNANTESVRRWYRWAHTSPIHERRTISRDGANRKPADCLLIASDERLLCS